MQKQIRQGKIWKKIAERIATRIAFAALCGDTYFKDYSLSLGKLRNQKIANLACSLFSYDYVKLGVVGVLTEWAKCNAYVGVGILDNP